MNKNETDQQMPSHAYVEAKRFGEIQIYPLNISWEAIASRADQVEIPLGIRWKSGSVFYSQAVYTGMCIADDLAFTLHPPLGSDQPGFYKIEDRWKNLRLVL